MYLLLVMSEWGYLAALSIHDSRELAIEAGNKLDPKVYGEFFWIHPA